MSALNEPMERLFRAAKVTVWPHLRDTAIGDAYRAARKQWARVLNAVNPNAPKGFIFSIDEWIAEDQKKSSLLENQPRSRCIPVFPEEQNIVFDPAVSSHERYPFWQRIRWSVFAEAKLYFLTRARIVGREGVVVSRDNRVIREFTYPPQAQAWGELSCFREARFRKAQKVIGWYATVNYRASTNYFHWMLECLPRMSLLEKFVPILDGVVVSESIMPFHRESLALLGVDPSKLIACSATTNIEFEYLFVPKYFARDNPPRWLHQWFKAKFLGPDIDELSKSARRKLYISRADAGTRRCLNDDELYGHLAPLGFERIVLTGMAFKEQATLFFAADTIVAHHGAGLANMVFCRPDTRLLEIFSKHWLAPCFFALSKSIGIAYDHLIAEADSRPEHLAGVDATVLDFEKAHSYSVYMPAFVEKVRCLL